MPTLAPANRVAITNKEKAFFSPFNHGRIIQMVKAGRDPKLLQEIPPVYLNLDITTRCNYECKLCIDRMGSDGSIIKPLDMDWNIVQNLLEYAKEKKLRGFIVQGKEPLIYPQIDEFLRTCASYNLALRLVTNGSQIVHHADALIAAFQQIESTIRISINADEAHYAQFTQGSTNKLATVLKGIEQLSRGGAKRVIVATVVFGRSFVSRGLGSNINQLEEIVSKAASAGAMALFFLPGRDPTTKEMVPFEEDELSTLEGFLPERKGMKIIMGGRFRIEEGMPARLQKKDYVPCPTGLLRVVVGSDGTIFQCTEHRGSKEAIIGEISPSLRFADVWHSEERAKRQRQFNPKIQCRDITCDRYGINTTVEAARRGYEEFGCPSIIRHILLDEEVHANPFF